MSEQAPANPPHPRKYPPHPRRGRRPDAPCPDCAMDKGSSRTTTPTFLLLLRWVFVLHRCYLGVRNGGLWGGHPTRPPYEATLRDRPTGSPYGGAVGFCVTLLLVAGAARGVGDAAPYGRVAAGVIVCDTPASCGCGTAASGEAALRGRPTRPPYEAALRGRPTRSPYGVALRGCGGVLCYAPARCRCGTVAALQKQSRRLL